MPAENYNEGLNAGYGWGHQEEGFSAMPPLQNAYPAGGNPPEGQRDQRKKRPDRPPAPTPAPVVPAVRPTPQCPPCSPCPPSPCAPCAPCKKSTKCKEKRERTKKVVIEGLHHLKESINMFKMGIETMHTGLYTLEAVAVEISDDDNCCPKPCPEPCPKPCTLILILGTCLPNGIWLSREELRGARELNAVVRYQHTLVNLVNRFWPDGGHRDEIDSYYLKRTIQIPGICNRRKVQRFYIQCAFSANCSKTPKTDCHRPPPTCCPQQIDYCCPRPVCCNPHCDCSGPTKYAGNPTPDVYADNSHHDFDPKDWDIILDKASSLFVKYCYE